MAVKYIIQKYRLRQNYAKFKFYPLKSTLKETDPRHQYISLLLEQGFLFCLDFIRIIYSPSLAMREYYVSIVMIKNLILYRLPLSSLPALLTYLFPHRPPAAIR